MNKFLKLKNILYKEIEDVKNIDDISENYEKKFLELVDIVNLNLINDEENFYGYFLLKAFRKVRYDIYSPTSIAIDMSGYTLNFNPILFLQLNLEQMKTTIKHEIIHILSLHIIRRNELKEKYSSLALNIAMDVVVNQFLDSLPPYATTIEWVNLKYNLDLKPYLTMEMYAKQIQEKLDLLEITGEEEEDDTKENEDISLKYDVVKTHDSWKEIDMLEEEIIKNITKKFAYECNGKKKEFYIDKLFEGLKDESNDIPWNLYLKNLIGNLQKGRKKTITRRNRRQPNRLELRGHISKKVAKIAVALDISGSISDEEFKLAINQVLAIVRCYKYEIIIVECDSQIQRVYNVKNNKDIKGRLNTRGSTKFSPVFNYVNQTDIDFLIYFTDGQGEEKLEDKIGNYKILWVLTGNNKKLSLEDNIGMIKKLNHNKKEEDVIEMLDVRNDGWSMNSQQPII